MYMYMDSKQNRVFTPWQNANNFIVGQYDHIKKLLFNVAQFTLQAAEIVSVYQKLTSFRLISKSQNFQYQQNQCQ